MLQLIFAKNYILSSVLGQNRQFFRQKNSKFIALTPNGLFTENASNQLNVGQHGRALRNHVVAPQRHQLNRGSGTSISPSNILN
jgi:hypothetical protein